MSFQSPHNIPEEFDTVDLSPHNLPKVLMDKINKFFVGLGEEADSVYFMPPTLDPTGFDGKYGVDDLRDFIVGDGLLNALRQAEHARIKVDPSRDQQ